MGPELNFASIWQDKSTKIHGEQVNEKYDSSMAFQIYGSETHSQENFAGTVFMMIFIA